MDLMLTVSKGERNQLVGVAKKVEIEIGRSRPRHYTNYDYYPKIVHASSLRRHMQQKDTQKH